MYPSCRLLSVRAMSFFSKIFGDKKERPVDPNDPLVPVPIPALAVLFLELEKEKGSPLTEEEILHHRDTCTSMMLRLSEKRSLEQNRGFRDIDPENCWEEWLIVRARNPNYES